MWISEKEYNKIMWIKPKNKYWAVRTNRNWIIFDSKAEADRYSDLQILEQSGYIKNLVLQPSFTLLEGFKRKDTWEKIWALKYRADFQYEQDWMIIVEDVKWKLTEVYKIKKKLFLAKYSDKYFFKETYKW